MSGAISACNSSSSSKMYQARNWNKTLLCEFVCSCQSYRSADYQLIWFHKRNLPALLTCRLQMIPALCITSLFLIVTWKLQINLQVPQSSHMLMHGSQVWCFFWSVKCVKFNMRGMISCFKSQLARCTFGETGTWVALMTSCSYLNLWWELKLSIGINSWK